MEAKKKAKEEARKVTEERKQAKKSYQESLQNVTTVRQQAAESGKTGAKKRDRVPSEVGESTPKANKKLKSAEKPQKTEPASQDTFTPFDYSQSQLKVFAGAKSKDNTQFDPHRQGHESKKKFPKGPKSNPVSGNRSMSYLPGKSNRGFRHNWPKR